VPVSGGRLVSIVMRFAFKTSPQDTTWEQMLAVWEEADDIDVFESGWTFDHFYPIFGNSTGPCLEGWTTLTRLSDMVRPARRSRRAARTSSRLAQTGRSADGSLVE
jgi:hypothetical protein